MMEPEMERHGAKKFTYKGLTMLGTESGAAAWDSVITTGRGRDFAGVVISCTS